jgi:glycosyltransferase involved in cell wall biosynthesis
MVSSIAFLAPADSIHSVRWIEYFQKAGIKIIWISLVEPTKVAERLARNVEFMACLPPGSDIHNRARLFFNLPAIVRKVKSLLIEHKPDVLHVHSAGSYGIVAKLSGFKPKIITPWGSDILVTNALKSQVARLILGGADFYTCDGENTRKQLIKLGCDGVRIQKIMFGTDVDTFSPPSPSIDKGRINIISLRQLEPLYDIPTLLKALPLVKKEIGSLHVSIVGDGSEREKLESISKDLGISDILTFHGRLPQAQIVNLLKSSDLYISTALSDSGLASSTAEAMACGLPVIVTDSADNKLWVKEGEGGYVIDCCDNLKLAEKIVLLANHPQKRKEFGNFNRSVIFEQNNYTKEMEKMLSIYSYVAEKYDAIH